MILYVAGPMRGYDQFNFPAFDVAARTLRAMGHFVRSPAERDREHGFDEKRNSLEGFDVEEALGADFRMILDSHGIVLLDGWEKSTGARAERFVAEMTGKDVFVLDEGDLLDAPEWNGDPRVEANVRDEDVDDAISAGKMWAQKAGLPWPDEVRVVNPNTGGEKGQKIERHDLIPVGPLKSVATHYGIGARKYADRNWEKGYAWSLSYGALQRHLTSFWNGEDIDPETMSPHLAAVVFHAFALMEFGRTHREMDDRTLTPATRG